MYGLMDIKKRYEETKALGLNSKISTHSKIGHKRNPTDDPNKKSYFHKDPLTPKNNPTKSAFGSYKNLPIEAEKHNSKDPYNIKFTKQKKTTSKISHLKENNKDQRKGKYIRTEVKSKSKSKEKSTFKSSLLKKF